LDSIKSIFGDITKTMQKVEPDFKGQIMPVESVEAMLKVVGGLTMEQSGDFVGHRGDKRWV
jgi:hypothetical protein